MSMFPAEFIERTPDDGPNRRLADSVVSGSLKESITSLYPKIAAVRKIFDEVSVILKKTRGEDSQLQFEWAEIVERFNTALENSRQVALNSARMIDDFRDSILPYLLGDDNFESKKQELLEYRESISSGQSLATNFLTELESIGKDLEAFRESRVKGLGVYEQISKRIKDLKERLHTLKNGIYRVTLSSNGNRKETTDNSAEIDQDGLLHAGTSGLRRKLHKCQAAFVIGNKTFKDVWALIIDDLSFIDGYVQRSAIVGARKDFQRRVVQLQLLYNGLQEVLEKYACVLSLQPDRSIMSSKIASRSFFRV